MSIVKQLSIVVVSVLAVCVSTPSLLSANLTAAVDGTYTYFVRGWSYEGGQGSTTPFTKMFYPGGAVHSGTADMNNMQDGTLVDTGSDVNPAGAPISFATGELTNGITADSDRVAGWISTLSPLVTGGGAVSGQFDILFDLGRVCNITDVQVWAGSFGGYRFTADSQELYLATALANPGHPADSDFSLISTMGIAQNDYTLTTFGAGEGAMARYVDMRFYVTTSITPSGGASSGGILNEIQINGSVPEPATCVILGFAGMLALLRRSRK